MTMNRAAAVLAAIAVSMTFAACEKEGPAERAGKKIDNAVATAGNKIEQAGDKIQDATKK
jgi:hypothetical protein